MLQLHLVATHYDTLVTLLVKMSQLLENVANVMVGVARCHNISQQYALRQYHHLPSLYDTHTTIYHTLTIPFDNLEWKVLQRESIVCN